MFINEENDNVNEELDIQDISVAMVNNDETQEQTYQNTPSAIINDKSEPQIIKNNAQNGDGENSKCETISTEINENTPSAITEKNNAQNSKETDHDVGVISKNVVNTPSANNENSGAQIVKEHVQNQLGGVNEANRMTTRQKKQNGTQ